MSVRRGEHVLGALVPGERQTVEPPRKTAMVPRGWLMGLVMEMGDGTAYVVVGLHGRVGDWGWHVWWYSMMSEPATRCFSTWCVDLCGMV
jgi:hypothetical protein